jgi:hypothetical protein
VPHQGLGPARLAGRAISVNEPLNSNYISIWLWGVLREPKQALDELARDWQRNLRRAGVGKS